MRLLLEVTLRGYAVINGLCAVGGYSARLLWEDNTFRGYSMRLLFGIIIPGSSSLGVTDIARVSRPRKNRTYTQNTLGVRVAILRSNMHSARWKLLRRLHMCKQGGLANPLHATPSSIGGEDLWATPQKGGHHTLYLWSACDQQEVPVG